MVIVSMFENIWNSIANVIRDANTRAKKEMTTVENDIKNDNKPKTVSFPQGAQFLNYRENKNIRGIPYLNMSSPNLDKSKYIDEIANRKMVLETVSGHSMDQNLSVVENFVSGKASTPENKCVDRDLEYYRNLNKKTREKQVAEQNRFYCLTGKDTHISESNTLLFTNMPYSRYTQPDDPTLAPWELQSMDIKTSPSILCDIKVIDEKDKSILGSN